MTRHSLLVMAWQKLIMSNLPFTLRQLDVFASLCSSGSFRKTSEDLGISQASVSSQIKNLEEQLGLSLFARRPGKNPTLTGEGAAFLSDLRDFERTSTKLASHRRQKPDFGEPISFRIRIGQGILDRFIRHRLGEFLAAHPDIELDFDAQPPGSHFSNDMLNGRLDFGLFHLRASDPVPDHLRPLVVVRGGVYGHRKFAQGKNLPMDAEEVSRLPFILPKAGSGLEKSVLMAMARYGIVPRQIVSHTQYFDVLATLMESGMGVASFSDAILPSNMREKVIPLHPLDDWRLVFFRKEGQDDPRCDAVERFLLTSVLEDESYPAMG